MGVREKAESRKQKADSRKQELHTGRDLIAWAVPEP
jgi:hypothetical protein